VVVKGSLVSSWAQAVADFLVPDSCQLCGRPRREEASPRGLPGLLHASVSVPFLGHLDVRNHPLCRACLDRLVPSESLTTGRILEGLPVIAPFRTNATLLAIVHRVKFSRFSSICGPLGAGMAGAWERAGGPRGTLVPVPMDKRSRRARGFNPAELLAVEMARRTGLAIDSGSLVKVRRTRPQSLTPERRRADNVRGAFGATGDRLDGRRVILVDDLVTTGATVTACTAALVSVRAVPLGAICVGEAL